MEIIKQINESCEHIHHSEHSHEKANRNDFTSDGVSSRIHEGALVCSGGRHIRGDLENVKQYLEKELGLLDEWVEEQEGITGHIKAVISVNGPAYRISAIAGEVETEGLGIKNVHVSIAAIVFQTDRNALEMQVRSILERLPTE